MRPPGPVLTLAEFVETSGMDPAFVHRMWVALGLPESTPVPLRVTTDVAAAFTVLTVMAAGMGEDAVLGFARVIGSAAARLADALSGAMRMGVEIPDLETGTPYVEVARQYSTAGRDLLPLLWDAIGAVFRRHLVLVSYAQWTPDPDKVAVTHHRTVGFADLVESTDVLTRLSVAELARLVEAFEQLVWEVVAATGGRVVKLIGDEAMFVHERPADACAAALRLVESSPHPIRIGLADGNVVALRGDFYGPTVNLAARLVRAAPPSSVVVSEAVREGAAGSRFSEFSTGPLRGFPDDTAAYMLDVS